MLCVCNRVTNNRNVHHWGDWLAYPFLSYEVQAEAEERTEHQEYNAFNRGAFCVGC